MIHVTLAYVRTHNVMSSVDTCVTLQCLCGRHLSGGKIHNSGRTKRGARLASNKIYVETQWTLFLMNLPTLPSSVWHLPLRRLWQRGGWVILAHGELLFQGRQVIKVSDKCRDRKLEFTFQPWGGLLHAAASTPKRFQKEDLNLFPDPGQAPRQQNDWFYFDSSHWKQEHITLWLKIIAGKEKQISAMIEAKLDGTLLRTSSSCLRL